MIRSLLAGSTLLALPACLHTATPVADIAALQGDVPLDARIWVSDIGHRELSIRLSAPAYVAVFEIVPGRGTSLLYPQLGQPAYLAAGSHSPMVSGYVAVPRSSARRASYGSEYDFGYGGRTSTAWTQPRQIFLVASVEPLRLDALGASHGGRSVLLSHIAYASFSSQAIMGSLLDVVLPRQGRGEWVTDVHTVWPEPSYPRGTSWEERRTSRPFWLSCGGEFVLVQAGTPFRILQRLFNSGCSIAASPDAQRPQQPQPPNKPDTSAVKPRDTLRITPPDVRGVKPRDTLAVPSVVPPGGAGLVHRIADRDGLASDEREAEARARAIARAQGRSTGVPREEIRSTGSAIDAPTPRGQDTRVAERILPADPTGATPERAERMRPPSGRQPAAQTPARRDPVAVPRRLPGQSAGEKAGERMAPRVQERARRTEPTAGATPTRRAEPQPRARANSPASERKATSRPAAPRRETHAPPRREPPPAAAATRAPVKAVEPPKRETKEPPPR